MDKINAHKKWVDTRIKAGYHKPISCPSIERLEFNRSHVHDQERFVESGYSIYTYRWCKMCDPLLRPYLLLSDDEIAQIRKVKIASLLQDNE
jgi:hypothetical protein